MRDLSYGAGRGGRLAVLAAGAILFCPAPLLAETTSTITFSDAMRIALEHNIPLQRSRNAADLDAVAVRRARLDFLPNLSLSSQGSQTLGTADHSSARSMNASLSSSLTLFDGFGNVATLRAAQLSQTAGRDDVQRAEQTVVFTVASNFLSLVQEQEQLGVQREDLAAAQALERQIQEYVTAGTRTVADLYQQQAIVASAQLAVVEADRAWQLAKIDLIETLQLDPAGVYVFEPPTLRADSSAAQNVNLDSLLARAWSLRTDLQAEQARLAAARQDVRAAGATAWPSVSLSARYGSSLSTASDIAFADQFDQQRGGSLGLGVAVPLFDRGSTGAAKQRARIQEKNSTLTVEGQRQAVGLEVRRAYLSLRAAQEQLRAAEAQQRAAERSLQTSQERYEAGAATLVELIQARATRVQAASAMVSGRYNLLFQRASVDYYVGEHDPAASLKP